MRAEPTQRLDRRAVQWWRVHAMLRPLLLALLAAMAARALIANQQAPPTWLLFAAAALLLLYGLFAVVVVPVLRWRIWRYDLNDHELYLKRGWLVVRRTVIPLVRIQHVDTSQGPLARYLKLSSVRVSTAAGTHDIPALSDQVADQLRDRLSQLARITREPL